MTQKVLQIGSSAGITLSKEAMRLLNVKVGDKVTVKVDAKRGGIVVLPLRESKDEAEFSDWKKEFLRQYGPALRALAKE